GERLRTVGSQRRRQFGGFIIAAARSHACTHLAGLKIARGIIVGQLERTRQVPCRNLLPFDSGIAELIVLRHDRRTYWCPQALAIVEERNGELIDERPHGFPAIAAVSVISSKLIRSRAGDRTIAD